MAINQITTPSWSLGEAIDGYAGAGISGIGIWRDKLAEYGVERTRRHLLDAGSWVASLCKAGDVAGLDKAGAGAAVDDCRQALDLAAEIGAPSIVFVCGGSGQSNDIDGARGRVEEVLQQAAEHARAVGVTIGLEPFHPMHAAERGCVNTIAQARAIRDRVGPVIGLVIDVFHCWWDPQFMNGLDPVDALVSVHLCDWRVPTRHPVMDRAMPGDGAANIPAMLHRLDELGYSGPFEIEVFSQDWASRAPDKVARECASRFRALGLLGQSGA